MSWQASFRRFDVSTFRRFASCLILLLLPSAGTYAQTCLPLPLTLSDSPKLTASDGATNDQFGYSMAVSGDTMVVGAANDDASVGSAYVFVRIGGVWTQQAKLTASDGIALDTFGFSVAIFGDTVVVGAQSNDIGANANQGSAYVFVKPGPGWSDMTQTAKLTASDGAANDELGYAVSISGDSVVVGARGDNSNQGSAYVFVKPGPGWSDMTQTAKLTASDGAANDFFGISVAISGDTVLVGASGDDIGAGSFQGSAYVFVKPGGGWVDMTQTAKLTASDSAAGDQFGRSIAASGNTVVVGANVDQIGPNTGQGSAYVFVEPGPGWSNMTQTAKLTASDGAVDDHFGETVGISGDTVVAGAESNDIGANSNQGSAYLFVKPRGGWCDVTESIRLTASDGADSDRFGYSAAVAGNTVVVGAIFDNIGANADQGSAYVYTIDCATSPLAAGGGDKLIASDGAAGDELGYSVAVSGDTMVAGAFFDDGSRGAAYVYTRTGGAWTQRARLTASDRAAGDQLGAFVAISGDTVVAGAQTDDSEQGSAYVFVKPAGGWTDTLQIAKLTASDRDFSDFFGTSVAVFGDTVVVGARQDNIAANADQGSAYVFVKPGPGWGDMTQTAKLTASDGAMGDEFGFSVAVSGDTVVVGAYLDDVGSMNQGSVYVFVKPSGGWADMTQTAKLIVSDGAADDQFAHSISISGNTIVGGARLDERPGGPNNTEGTAYVFVKPGAGWSDITETAELTASDAAAVDFFGTSVSVSGDTIAVGAPVKNGSRGSVYVFSEPVGGWCDSVESVKLTAPDEATGDRLGWSVSISGGTVVGGAYSDDVGANADQGSAYVFNLGILFVDAAMTPLQGDGSSWTNAYNRLQDALAYAAIHPEVSQIWVADGTYEPDQGMDFTPEDRSATFELIDGLALYGGFRGNRCVGGPTDGDFCMVQTDCLPAGICQPGETTLSQRNPALNPTILSGDLLGDDGPAPFQDYADNSYHVVTANGVGATTVLDGFTVRGGYANAANPNERGGGMLVIGGGPTVVNCTFRDNKQDFQPAGGGGGVSAAASTAVFSRCSFIDNATHVERRGAGAVVTGGSVRFSDCTFQGNNGGFGGGFNDASEATSLLERCTFFNNSAVTGGAIAIDSFVDPTPPYTDTTILGCVFVGNTATTTGGAIHVSDNASLTGVHLLLSGNSATSNGGGVVSSNGIVSLINTTLSRNSAGGQAGGIYSFNTAPDADLDNCILWNNTDSGPTDESAQIQHLDGGVLTVSYSVIQGMTGNLCGAGNPCGAGNLGADPLFVDADGPDNIVGTTDDNLRLQSGSPCIDAANNVSLPLDDPFDLDGDGITSTEYIAHDLAGNPRILDDPAATDTGASGVCLGGPMAGLPCAVDANCMPSGTCNCPVPPCDVFVDMGPYEYFTDCNDDDVPDVCNRGCGAAGGPCDLPGCGGSNDCNTNNVLDQCDIADCTMTHPDFPGCDDCNLNGKPDSCDITDTTSMDVLPSGMPDGIPDECTIFDGGGGNSNWNTATNWTNNTVPNNMGPNVFNVTIDAANTVNLNIPAEVDSLRLLDAGTLNVTGAAGEDLIIDTVGGILIRGDLATNEPSELLVGNDRLIDASAGQVTLGPAGVYAESPTTPATDPCLAAGSVQIDQGLCSCGPQVEVDGGYMELTGGMQANVGGDMVLAGSGQCLPCPTAFRGITPPPKLCVTGGSSNRTGANGEPGLPGSRTGSPAHMVDCSGNNADLTIGGNLIMHNAHAYVQIGGANCVTLRPRAAPFHQPASTLQVSPVFQAEPSTDVSRETRSAGPSMAQVFLGGNLVLERSGNIDWLNAKMTLNGTGPQSFEVASADVGPAAAGFSGNFALGEMELLPNRSVTLLDEFDNTSGDGMEALYVNTLTLGSGSTLIVRNCVLFYTVLINNGGALVPEGFGRASAGPAAEPPLAVTAGQLSCRKNRYICFQTNNPGASVAFEVQRAAMPALTGYAGPPTGGVSGVYPAPHFRNDWPATLCVGDCEIAPLLSYDVRATTDGATFSSILTVQTIAQPGIKVFGDTTGSFNATFPGQWDCPNLVVNANDFQMALQKFLGAATAPHNTMSNVQAVSSIDPCLNSPTNIADVFLIVKGFQGEKYPFYSCSGNGKACSTLGAACPTVPGDAAGTGTCQLPTTTSCPPNTGAPNCPP